MDSAVPAGLEQWRGSTAEEQPCCSPRPPGSLLELAWARYKRSLSRQPLLTKSCTSAAVASLSDIIAQRLIGGSYSPARTLKMALWGLCIGAPAAHFWHMWLQRLFAGKRDSFETAIKKVVVDQLLFGPAYNLAFLAYTSMAVHGMGAGAFQRKAVAEFPALQVKGWKVWSVVGLVNYRFVPLQFRVLFANFAALFWSVFVILSGRASAGRRIMPSRPA